MATRNISLTETLDRFVEEKVESGVYQNASEVVRAGLRLLLEQSDAHAAMLERLRAAIQEGADDYERGEYQDVEWDQLDSWMAERGRRTGR